MGRLKLQDTTEKNFHDAFREFINYCRVRNLSQYTLDYYEMVYKKFVVDFYGEKNKISKITNKTIQDFILHCKNKNMQDSSINTYLNGIRTMLNYFFKLGYVDKITVQLLKTTEKIKEIYTVPELKLLLKKPNIKKCSFTEYRDFVICNTFTGTGIRVNTLINLKVKDVDLYNKVLILRVTKNRRETLLPMPDILIEILQEYLQFRKYKDENDWLFCSVYGVKLTRNAIEHSLRLYNRRRGVMKTGIHRYRYTYAKMYLCAGGSALKLQKLLCHSSLEMVKRYVQLFTGDLQKDYNTLNPLSQIISNGKQIKMKGRR